MASKKYISLSKLSAFLDNLKNTFASKNHTHYISEVIDYKVDSSLSSTSTNPVQNKVLDAEFEAISEALNIFEDALDNMMDAGKLSDYYTKTEIDNLVLITVNEIDTICGKA